MPIYFNSAPTDFPFQFDSIGNNWNQEPTLRPDGFPVYHYLQTQEGSGILSIDEKKYTIGENQGVLLAPGIPHVYHSASGQWITLFATFSGSMSPYFSALFGSSHLLFFENQEKAASTRKLLIRPFFIIRKHRQILNFCLWNVIRCFCSLSGDFSLILLNSQPGKNMFGRFLPLSIPDIWKILPPTHSVRKSSSHHNICPGFFSRYLGCSVYEYLTKFRISKAKELLVSHRTRKIQDISQDVGYTDASHFVLMFQKNNRNEHLQNFGKSINRV